MDDGCRLICIPWTALLVELSLVPWTVLRKIWPVIMIQKESNHCHCGAEPFNHLSSSLPDRIFLGTLMKMFMGAGSWLKDLKNRCKSSSWWIREDWPRWLWNDSCRIVHPVSLLSCKTFEYCFYHHYSYECHPYNVVLFGTLQTDKSRPLFAPFQIGPIKQEWFLFPDPS